MGDPFSNWYESSLRARTYHDSLVREAVRFRAVQAGARRGIAFRVLDHLGRALIATGRVLRRTVGQSVIPEGRGCCHPVVRR